MVDNDDQVDTKDKPCLKKNKTRGLKTRLKNDQECKQRAELLPGSLLSTMLLNCLKDLEVSVMIITTKHVGRNDVRTLSSFHFARAQSFVCNGNLHLPVCVVLYCVALTIQIYKPVSCALSMLRRLILSQILLKIDFYKCLAFFTRRNSTLFNYGQFLATLRAFGRQR